MLKNTSFLFLILLFVNLNIHSAEPAEEYLITQDNFVSLKEDYNKINECYRTKKNFIDDAELFKKTVNFHCTRIKLVLNLPRDKKLDNNFFIGLNAKLKNFEREMEQRHSQPGAQQDEEQPGAETDNIEGLNIKDVIRVLYESAKPIGMGYHAAKADEVLKDDLINNALKRKLGNSIYIDYLNGRPLKIFIYEKDVDTELYNQNHGENAAEKAIAKLRSKNSKEGQ